MGSFSWLRACGLTKQSNIIPGDTIKFLIPQEFGGGFIKGMYDDYGMIETSDGFRFDVYNILAVWNMDALADDGKPVKEHIVCDGEIPTDVRGIVENVQSDSELGLRHYGIEIGCYRHEVAQLKYPLKMVSASYKGTYEDCKHRSYSDPEQGFYKTYWDESKPKLKDIPVYPINGTEKEIENYWNIIAGNEICCIRYDALKEIEDRKNCLTDISNAITGLRNAWVNCASILDSYDESKEFIEEAYPFDKPFDEIEVYNWTGFIMSKISKALQEINKGD